MDMLWRMLLTAFVSALVLAMEILAITVFPTQDGTQASLAFVLIPLLIAPLPMAILKCFTQESGFMAEVPRGQHWAEFSTSFIASGIVAVPVMLFLTDKIRWEALALSLGGFVLALLGLGVGAYLTFRENDDTFSSF